jgi:hypothetical protein
MKTAALCTSVVLLSLSFTGTLTAQAGPGKAVYESILHIWDQAPSKFSEFTGGRGWEKMLGSVVNTERGSTPFSDFCDIPEFERESAMAIPHKDSPTSYSISAKRFFTSDDACHAYYQALIAKLPGLLEKDDAKLRKKDDHISCTQQTETYRRRLYVKYYAQSSEKNKKARVYISVSVVILKE